MKFLAIVGFVLVAAHPLWCAERNTGRVFEVATAAVRWTDVSRQRDVPVLIYAPDLKHGNGPFPAVVFSHGGGESGDAFGYLGNHWASHGYIAVFLTHPGSDRAAIEASGKTGLAAMAALDGIDKFHRRPEDVRFALSRLLSEEPGSKLLAGRVDADRLAMAGQCAGATTALAMVGLRANLPEGKDVTFLDPRFKCAIALSPQPIGRPSQFGLHAQSWGEIHVPTLVVTGSRDFNWFPQIKANPKLVRLPYDGLPPGDKYLVEIADAEHNAFTDSVPYYPARARDDRHHGWICEAATAFLDAQLKGDEAARGWLDREELEKVTKGACRQESKPFNFSAVDAHIEGALDRIGGGCGLILIKDDRVVHRKAYGTFRLDRVVPIASASKWISGGVIMALVDEGVIGLDTKASAHLKTFTGDKAEITIRQLFSHTHGFPDEPHPHRNVRLTMEQAVDQIAEVPLAHDPGTALLYSGLGMQAAGRICELAAGKDWTRLFHEKIGEPLRMEKTDYFAFGQTANPNVAGSVRTCLDDYGNFVRMLLNGGLFEGKRVISEKAVETMLTNQTGAVPIERSACQPYADIDAAFAESRYGIGCWLEEIDPVTGAAREATSAGAFGCVPFVDRQRKIAGVYLPMSRNMKTNRQGDLFNDASAVFLELRPLIRDAFDGKTPATAAKREEVPEKPREPTGEGDVENRVERMFQLLDRNRDGALSREEMPERLKRAFGPIDGDRNGKVSQDEMSAALEQYQRRQGGREETRREQPRREETRRGEEKPTTAPGVGCADPVRLHDAERDKDLQVRVTWPEAPGSFPVIVFSHRVGGARHDYGPLVEHWAKGGYVVIQADHADSRELAPSGTRLDWASRARDLSFLIDSLPQIEAKVPGVKGKMDAERVGVGGHLIGAYAAGVLVGQRNYRTNAPQGLKDDRVQAALLLSPQGRGQGLTETSWEDVAGPMMVVSGSGIPSVRTGNPAEWRREPFTFSPPGDKYLVWIEGLEGTYAGLIQPGQGDDERAATWILDATLAFWDAHLRQDVGAREQLRAWPGAEADRTRLHIECKVEADAAAASSAPAREAGIEQYLPDEEEMMSWIRTIQAQGARRAGSPADLWLEGWAVGTFKSWGISDVRVQRLEVPYWRTGESFIKAGRETIGCFPMAAGDWKSVIEGELCVHSDNVDPASLKGKIVLLDYPLATTRPELSARRSLYVYDPDNDLITTSHANPLTQKSPAASTVHDILAARPAAVIGILGNYFDSHMIFGRHTNGREKTNGEIPLAWLSSSAGARLKTLIAGGVKDAELTLDCENVESRSSNIIAFLPGSGDNYIIVGSHRDQAFSQAVQDTSGISVVLAQARYWSRVPIEQRPHNFIFLLSAGHLLGTKGVQAFLHEYKDLIDKTVIELHVEHVGLEGKVEDEKLVVLDRPEPRLLFVPSTDVIENAAKEAVAAEDLRRTMIGGPPPHGDGWPFHIVGIPTVQFASIPVYLLDQQDTLDKVDQKGLVKVSRVFVRLIEATRGMSADEIRASDNHSSDRLSRITGRFDRNGDGVLQTEERLEMMDFIGGSQ